MDNLILNVALPTLQRDLGASPSDLQWVVDAYTMVFAAILFVTGTFGDRFGRKRVLDLGLLLFVLGSLGAAYSGSVGVLIAFRAFMGVGAAMVMPATLSVLINVFPSEERAKAIGIWAAGAAVGIPLGPVAGGILLEHFWWGSVFLVNVPIVAGALVAGYYLVPESRDPNAGRPDLFGALLSVAGLGSLIYGIIEAPTNGWTDFSTVAFVGLGVVLIGVFIAWEIKTDDPMLPVEFFRNPSFSAAAAAITLLGFGLFGAVFLLTQYLQSVLGLSPLEAGLRILAVAAIVLGAPTGVFLASKVGTKLPVAAGLTAVALALFTISTLDAGSGTFQIVWRLGLLGFGMGLTMAPVSDSLMGSVPKEKAGVGSATEETGLQLGGALGIAILGSASNSSYSDSMKDAIKDLGIPNLPSAAQGALTDSIGAAGAAAQRLGDRLGGPFGERLLDAAKSSFVDGMGDATLIAAGTVFAGALIVLTFLPAKIREADPAQPNPGSGTTTSPVLAGIALEYLARRAEDTSADSPNLKAAAARLLPETEGPVEQRARLASGRILRPLATELLRSVSGDGRDVTSPHEAPANGRGGGEPRLPEKGGDNSYGDR